MWNDWEYQIAQKKRISTKKSKETRHKNFKQNHIQKKFSAISKKRRIARNDFSYQRYVWQNSSSTKIKKKALWVLISSLIQPQNRSIANEFLSHSTINLSFSIHLIFNDHKLRKHVSLHLILNQRISRSSILNNNWRSFIFNWQPWTIQKRQSSRSIFNQNIQVRLILNDHSTWRHSNFRNRLSQVDHQVLHIVHQKFSRSTFKWIHLTFNYHSSQLRLEVNYRILHIVHRELPRSTPCRYTSYSLIFSNKERFFVIIHSPEAIQERRLSQLNRIISQRSNFEQRRFLTRRSRFEFVFQNHMFSFESHNSFHSTLNQHSQQHWSRLSSHELLSAARWRLLSSNHNWQSKWSKKLWNSQKWNHHEKNTSRKK